MKLVQDNRGSYYLVTEDLSHRFQHELDSFDYPGDTEFFRAWMQFFVCEGEFAFIAENLREAIEANGMLT